MEIYSTRSDPTYLSFLFYLTWSDPGRVRIRRFPYGGYGFWMARPIATPTSDRSLADRPLYQIPASQLPALSLAPSARLPRFPPRRRRANALAGRCFPTAIAATLRARITMVSFSEEENVVRLHWRKASRRCPPSAHWSSVSTVRSQLQRMIGSSGTTQRVPRTLS